MDKRAKLWGKVAQIYQLQLQRRELNDMVFRSWCFDLRL